MSQPPAAAGNRRDSFRRHAREGVRVTCHRGAEAAGEDLALALLDASQTGMQLLVRGAVEKGQPVTVGLEGPGQAPLRRAGTVAWCVAEAGQGWRIGVRLAERVSYLALIRLTEL